MMRAFYSFFLLIFLLTIAHNSTAQFGVSFQQQTWSADNWEEVASQNDSLLLADKNLRFGLSYWLRLKNNRIEFHPEVAYTFSIDDRLSAYEGQRSAWIFQVSTAIYPFDLQGDCNCPTFSKQGNFLQKGIFVELSPGVEYQINKVFARSTDQSIKEEQVSKHMTFHIGAAIGLDFGISDLLTLSPTLNGLYIPGAKWEGFQERFAPDVSTELNKSSLLAFGFGIRALFRPDYRKPGF